MRHFAGTALVLFAMTAGTARADMQGVPAIIDGDTLRLDGSIIHLFGIDAPENAQTCQNKRGRDFDCGATARRTLALIVADRPVLCREMYRDGRGDSVAVCTRGRTDIAEQLILQGWALTDPETGTTYRRAERAAQGMREGLWRLKFIPPWEWRGANK
jgi:endonuclease YncB( thermonuclease family)